MEEAEWPFVATLVALVPIPFPDPPVPIPIPGVPVPVSVPGLI